MAAVAVNRFLESLQRSKLLEEAQLQELPALQDRFPSPRELAQEMVRRNWLTVYQVNQLSQGKAEGLILGQYLLLERIGEGGMGEVFRARQRTLDRVVALKIIRKECLDNPRVIQRFQREIRAAGQLSHPHIVHAYDADQIDGAYYIAMEYIDGVDLSRLVKQSGPLQVLQACDYIRQAALGLQHAHEQGLIHRDLKPANLLVTQQYPRTRASSALLPRPRIGLSRAGVSRTGAAGAILEFPWGMVKILDMGLARWNEDSGRTTTHLTQLGSIMGTPDFISPEQARNSQASDIRGDLYSLGCTFYFLLAGRLPFPNGSLTEKLLQHQFDEPEAIEQVRRVELIKFAKAKGQARLNRELLKVPGEVAALVKKLMAKKPEDRVPTPQELADALAVLQRRRLEAKSSGEITVAEDDTMIPPFQFQADTIVKKPDLGAARGWWAKLGRRKSAALIGGVMCLGLIVAALAGKATNPEASPLPADQAKERPEETLWGQLREKARQRQGNFDELRLELVRFRSANLRRQEAQEVPGLLARLPSPLDALERATIPKDLWFDWQPKEMVGALGSTSNLWKRRAATAVAISPDGRWIAAGYEDALLRTWDAKLFGLARQGPSPHSNKISRVAFSPDGRSFASASWDGKAKIWDVKSARLLFTLDKHQKPVLALAYSPDAKTLATGGFDGMIRLWDTSTGQEKAAFDGQAGRILTLAFSSAGDKLFGGGDKRLVRWMIPSAGMPSPEAALKLDARTLSVSPNGQTLVLSGGDDISFHRARWGGSPGTSQDTISIYKCPSNDADFAPDGKRFATVGDDKLVRVWASATAKLEHTFEMRWPVLGVAFAPDNRHLLTANGNGTVYVFRLGKTP